MNIFAIYIMHVCSCVDILFSFKPYANWLEHFAAAVSSFFILCSNCALVVVVAGVFCLFMLLLL